MSEIKGLSISAMIRLFLLVLIFGGVILALMWRMGKLEKELEAYRNAPADTVQVVLHDTIKVDSPIEINHYIKEKEYIAVKDSVLIHDTLTQSIFLPRECRVYGDTSYRAVISGVNPSLDSLEIYQKTYIQTITKTVTKTDKRRWGLGVSVGAGWNGKKVQPFLGVGVQYNIVRW